MGRVWSQIEENSVNICLKACISNEQFIEKKLNQRCEFLLTSYNTTLIHELKRFAHFAIARSPTFIDSQKSCIFIQMNTPKSNFFQTEF